MLVSDRAFRMIEQLLEEEREYVDRHKLVPIITWIFNRSGDANNPGPVLGLIEPDKIEANLDSYTKENIVIYNGLPLDLQSRFDKHTLDFRDGSFQFVFD